MVVEFLQPNAQSAQRLIALGQSMLNIHVAQLYCVSDADVFSGGRPSKNAVWFVSYDVPTAPPSKPSST